MYAKMFQYEQFKKKSLRIFSEVNKCFILKKLFQTTNYKNIFGKEVMFRQMWCFVPTYSEVVWCAAPVSYVKFYVPLVGIMLVKIPGMCRVTEIKIILGKGQFVTNAVKLPMDK
jgi:hypothetical protein